MIAATPTRSIPFHPSAPRLPVTQPSIRRPNDSRLTTIDGVTYKVAHGVAERRAAYRLCYDLYTKAGLIPDNPHAMRATPYHLSPMTDTYMAYAGDTLVYTVTLVTDDVEGLPLETIYPAEVEAMRREGLTLAEVSCLAGRNDLFDRRKNFQIYVNLIGLMVQSARANGVDRLLLAVHPRHVKFYERFFGCQRLGERKSYEAVCGNPAILAVHDFERCDREKYKLYDALYSLRFAPHELLRQPMTALERDYFEMVARECDRVPVAVSA